MSKENNKRQSPAVFKNSDYDLDRDERRYRFRGHDSVLCEKCNQKFDYSSYYCKICYKKETDDIEKKHMLYGKCKKCFRVLTYYNWCLCNSIQRVDVWTGGNKDLDRLIQDNQLLAYTKILEWIPYNRFS